MVVSYFQQAGFTVETSEERYRGKTDDALIRAATESGCGWIINALGRIKQVSEDADQLYLANTIFPQHLVSALAPYQRLLHASTDCVFSGRRGWYGAEESKDPADVYGLSKALGENIAADPRVLVIRASIIGPESNSGRGLLGWFFKQTGPVRGYTNHFWNGITSLEWAEAALEVIAGAGIAQRGVVQAGTLDPISKFELLCLVRKIWGQSTEIEPYSTGDRVDRSLKPQWVRQPIGGQLHELYDWVHRHRDTAA